MTEPQSPITILGAGPSGLLLANLLERHAIPYIIYERDDLANPDIRGSSGTLDIHVTTGQLALTEAGLFEDFKALARYDVSTTIAKRSGEVVFSIAQDGGVNEESRPEIDRRDLRQLLLKGIPAERVCWEKKVVGVERDEVEKTTTIRFADGTVVAGVKLLVGADGAWSKARSLVTSLGPEYSGTTFITTNIAAESSVNAVAKKLAGRGSYIALGEKKQISTQMLADGSYYTCFGIKGLSENWSKENTDLVRDPQALREYLLRNHFSSWDPALQELVGKSEGGFYIWPLYSLPTRYLDEKSVSGVTLMGDAAHVTPPSGEGVNWALFDGLQLARQIIKHRHDEKDNTRLDLDSAVREYEAEAKPRWRETITSATKMLESMYADDSPEGFLQAIFEDA